MSGVYPRLIFMKVLIAVNAYIKNKSQISQAERIAEELYNLGATPVTEKNFNLARVEGNKISAANYDFCVFLDKDRVAARLLEGRGMRLFNSASAIEVCDDKMLTFAALANAGFNLPDSLYAPLCYHPESEINEQFLREVAEKLGFPLVAKTNYGSLGAGVNLIKDFGGLKEYERKNLTLPHFYQQFIDCGGGIDTRVIVIGGEAVCAMKRQNGSDFRSNIEQGGRGEKCALTDGLSKLCSGVARRLGLDYCGVDVLTDRQGRNYICEVNSNAFFATAERVCGVYVARAYAEHMLKTYKGE